MSQPVFWRDPGLPHAELRKVDDGRTVCYAPHTHAQWSMGAITAGRSTFVHGTRRHLIEAGSLVIINPEWVHACNPICDQAWAYFMLYVDANWLAGLRHRIGLSTTPQWQDLDPDVIRAPMMFADFVALCDCLLDPAIATQQKDERLIAFFTALLPRLPARAANPAPPPQFLELAAYLDEHCTEELSLEALCQRADCSPGHLIRSFKRHFRMTPHAYLINRRIQFGLRELRRGQPIAEAALDAGFADQPHFQRTFKRLVAATPGQYQQPSID